MKRIPKETLAAALEDKKVVPEDKLERIRDLATTARELDLEIRDEEERLKQRKKRLAALLELELPDLMGEVGIDNVGVPAKGNMPAFDIKVVTERSANIAAGWEEERRQEAIQWLIDNGHGDIVKSSLRIDFPREKIEEARAAADLISDKFGIDVEVSESVHPQTMSAWFREACASHLVLPALDLIGAR